MSLNEPYHITIEIINKECRGLRMLENSGVEQCTLADIRSLPTGQTRHLIKIPKEQIRKISKDNFAKISDNSNEAWFDSDGCNVCNTILSHMSFLVSARHISDYTIIYNFLVPNHETFKNIISTLEDRGFEPKILEVTKFTPKTKVLTEKQERVLWLALKLGFFDYPRKIDSNEFSQKLGIVTSSLSEITRRGIRKLLKYYFEDELQ